jgi:hypothetical protein
MTSRAVAFVVLGVSIGVLIGLAQVVLREAWLTVRDGYRSGRQLILSAPVTVLGRGEYVGLPFLGTWGKGLAPEHAAILRQPDGSYAIEDRRTELGTQVNGKLIQGRTSLRDGDLIKLGTNYICFSERQRKTKADSLPVAVPATPSVAPVAAPPRVQPVAAAGPSASVRPVPPPPVRPQPPTAPPAKPAGPPPQAVPRPAAFDACPKCQRRCPGTPGKRYCLVCDVTF